MGNLNIQEMFRCFTSSVYVFKSQFKFKHTFNLNSQILLYLETYVSTSSKLYIKQDKYCLIPIYINIEHYRFRRHEQNGTANRKTPKIGCDVKKLKSVSGETEEIPSRRGVFSRGPAANGVRARGLAR